MAALRDRLPADRRVRQGEQAADRRRPTCRAASRPTSGKKGMSAVDGLRRGPRLAARELPVPDERQLLRPVRRGDGQPRGGVAELLLRAVREGRDDGGVGGRDVPQDAPAASRSSTSTARSTATSARAPPRARGAGCPAAASPSSRSCRSPTSTPSKPAGRRSQAGRLSRLYSQEVGRKWNLDLQPTSHCSPLAASPRSRTSSPRSRPTSARCRADRSCPPCRPACGGSGSSCRPPSSDSAGMPACWTLGPMSAPPPLGPIASVWMPASSVAMSRTFGRGPPRCR